MKMLYAPSGRSCDPDAGKPSNTEKLSARIMRLAREGYGFEDIIVRLRADGCKVTDAEIAEIRRFVLGKSTTALRRESEGR